MKLQLQSILLPTEEICDVEELYFHKSGGEVRFDGYFNLFYIEKRKAYTQIENLSLQLTMQGYSELILMHDEDSIGSIILAPDEKKEYVIAFPYDKYEKGIFWFKLKSAIDETKGEHFSDSISGFFITDISEDELRYVNIGIDICTYKREEYIIRNLNQLKDKLLFNDQLDAASHYMIYVIDNGKTLQNFSKIEKLKKEYGNRLKVIPNKNSGGAGGFTRGMLEILNDKEKLGLTHVLVMDDDAIIEPDSMVRIYGLLATLKDDWKNVTVGGAMLREDYQYSLFCAGEYWRSGYIYNHLMHTDLRDYSNATIPLLTETGHEFEWYSGWWLCCYSLSTVRKDNLPLPLFMHHDDIEYGTRNMKQGVIFLNGIGVWHKRPDETYLGSNLYYDIRNNLIEIALNEKKGKRTFTAAWLLFKSITSAAIRLRYADAELVYKGFRDFLKGPKWLCQQDPDELNSSVRAMAIPMEPIETVLARLSEDDKKAAKQQLDEYNKANSHGELIKPKGKYRGGMPLYWFTFNGWILPADKKEIKLVAATESPYKGFRKERILLYEPGTKKTQVVTRNKEGMKEIRSIYRKTAALFVRYFRRACVSWEKNAGKITNKKAWEKYLEE